MASVDFKKIKTISEVKAILRHNCNDTREKSKTHNNPHLQSDLTKNNTGLIYKYDEACKMYDDRLSKLPKPKRKDTVMGVGLSIPIPDDLPDDKQEEWSDKVYGILCKEYGQDNMVCWVIHRDEVHEYKDRATGEWCTSRTHIHGVLIPEVDGRLCAKQITAKSRMIAVNNYIDKMSKKDYGVQFKTGTGQKSRGDVEYLKIESAKALEETIQDMQQQMQDMQQQITSLAQQNIDLQEKNEELEEQVDGFLPSLIFKKAVKRKEQAEQDAEKAQQEQVKAEQLKQTAEEQAQQALKMVQEARESLKVIQDTIEEEKAHSKALREDMGDIMANARMLLAALKKQESATVSVHDANLLQVAKDIKFEDGKTMYDLLEQKAIQVKKANQKQIKQFGDSLESKITKQTRRSIPDVSHIVSEQHDNDFSL